MISAEEFSQEYTNGYAITLRTIRARTNATSDFAAEIAQAAWVRAWERRAQFDGLNNCKFATWVFTIAFNLWRMDYRRIARANSLNDPVDVSGIALRPSAGRASDPEQRIYVQELLCKIRAADREIIEQVSLDADATPALMFKRLAVTYGLNPRGVKARYWRAIQAMRKAAGVPVAPTRKRQMKTQRAAA